jgi:hypothetical protein
MAVVEQCRRKQELCDRQVGTRQGADKSPMQVRVINVSKPNRLRYRTLTAMLTGWNLLAGMPRFWVSCFTNHCSR